MNERTWKWTDAHFYSLPSQTSIYGCTKILNNVHGTNKLLLASLIGRFFTIEYQRIFEKLTPCSKEVNFTYIPGDYEIVSIDAVNQCCHGKGLTIGITFWKMEDNESKEYLHIYSSPLLNEEFNLENVAHCCQSLELSFMPYHLTHTELVSGARSETVFMLSGSDNKIHMYREVNRQHSFKESDCEEYFPELRDFTSVAMWLDIMHYDKKTRRITSTGHQDGTLNVSIVNVEKCEVLQHLTADFDSPITYVQTFSLFNNLTKPIWLDDVTDESKTDEGSSVPELNVLVLSALIPAAVYLNVLSSGLQELEFLPDSNKFDTVLTGCVTDIDFDGENEILIGTYGQEVLAYKLGSRQSARLNRSAYNQDRELDDIDAAKSLKSWQLLHDLDMPPPSKSDLRTSRRVKSQENLPSSIDSDNYYIMLASSKEDVTSNPAMFQMETKAPKVTGKEDIKEQIPTRLLWQRSFPCPVMGIRSIDITGDGLQELVIVTLKGVHIFQPDLNEVADMCLERLKLLVIQKDEKKALSKGTQKDCKWLL